MNKKSRTPCHFFRSHRREPIFKAFLALKRNIFSQYTDMEITLEELWQTDIKSSSNSFANSGVDPELYSRGSAAIQCYYIGEKFSVKWCNLGLRGSCPSKNWKFGIKSAILGQFCIEKLQIILSRGSGTPGPPLEPRLRLQWLVSIC